MLKKYKNYLVIICISLSILFLYIFINQDFNLYNNVIVNDLKTQYASLIQYIKNCFLGYDSFLYSFSKGIGGNMISTIAYYLTSPLNLLCLLFDNINIGIMLGIICRFILANITMYIYLKDKFDKKDCLIFSTIYAFSGYMVLYYFNIMWIDIVVIAPIILKYIDKLVSGKFSIVLPILLALSLVLNYYISYMLFIFVIIYTLYMLFLKYTFKVEKKKIFKVLGLLVLSFFLALCLSSFIILPTVLDMINNMFRYSINKDVFNFDLSRLAMIISRFFIGAYDNTTRFNFNEVCIYITVLGLVLLIKYFFNKTISKKEKILSLTVMLVFIFSVTFELLNLIWHGFSFPNGYNYRFSFVFCLFFCYLACRQYSCNQKLSLKILIPIILAFGGICLFLKGRYVYLSDISIIMTFIFFVMYLVLLNFNKFKWGVIALVILELVINFNMTFSTGKRLEYNNDVYNYHDEFCKTAYDIGGNYRVSIQNIISSDDGFLCNIKDVGVTLTTNNKRYYQFMHNIGYPVTYSTITKNIFAGPFVDSILGVERALRINENHEIYYIVLDVYKIYYDSSSSLFMHSHTNPYALSLGYVINDENIEYDNNPFENQNRLAKSMSGLDLNIFDVVELKEVEELLYEFKTDQNYFYVYNYFPIPINLENYINIYVDEFRFGTLNSFNNGILFIPNENINQDSILRIEMRDKKYLNYVNPLVYTFNFENFKIIMNELQKHQMEVSYFNNNKIEGNISLNEDSKVMVSVPNEKGWVIKVNGKKVDYDIAYDTFVLLNLEKGENHIEMSFIPPGCIVGTIVSILTLIILFYKREKLR